MTLAYKIKRLIKADAHAVVDQFERPDRILAQAIRDMEVELAKLEEKVSQHRTALNKTEETLSLLKETIIEVDDGVRLAVAEKKEDLAKSLIRRFLGLKRQLEKTQQIADDQRQAFGAINGEYLEKNNCYLDVLNRAPAHQGRLKTAPVFDGAQNLVKNMVDDDQVELEFLKRLKSSQKEG